MAARTARQGPGDLTSCGTQSASAARLQGPASFMAAFPPVRDAVHESGAGAGGIDVRAASDPAFRATGPGARIALAVAPAPMIPLASVSESAV